MLNGHKQHTAKTFERTLREVVKAWERLPAGYHNKDTINNWLMVDMAPVINRARSLLKE